MKKETDLLSMEHTVSGAGVGRSRGLPWRAPAARMELRREQLLAARRLVNSFARSRAELP